MMVPAVATKRLYPVSGLRATGKADGDHALVRDSNAFVALYFINVISQKK